MKNPSIKNRLRKVLFIAVAGLLPGALPAGDWRFEEFPPADGPFPLKALARPRANTLQAADAGVAAKSASAKALANPALMAEGDADLFDIAGESWTLSGWFRNAARAGSMQGAQTLAATRHSSSKFKGWDLVMVDGAIRFLSSPPRGTGRQFVTAKRYDDGRWHFFQLIHDVALHQVSFYVDGEKAGVADDVPQNAGVPGRVFAIGAKIRDSALTTHHEWQGEIDEWKFEPGTIAAPVIEGFPLPGAAAGASSRPASAAPLTSQLRVIRLPGQIALTWKEQGTAPRILLVSGQPLDEANRSAARVVAADLLPRSANDWFEDPAETPKATGPRRGWVLNPASSPLPPDDGAFVYTCRADDPASLWFAVVTADESIEPGRNATIAPEPVSIGPPQPIALSPDVVEAMQKAPKGLPVLLYLHPHTSRPFPGKLTHLLFGDETMGWREGLPFKLKVEVKADHILVEPYDRVWINRRLTPDESADSYERKFRNVETFWYGTNSRIDSREARKEGMAVNYTHRWLLRMLDWVIQSYGADANRVYASGTSMGTAVQLLAVANPGRFASVDVLVPFVDWSYAQGGESNARRLLGVCGPMTTPTPGGAPFADKVNLVKMISGTKDDLPFMILRTGRNDRSVFWRRKPAYFRAMNERRNGILASWDQGAHTTAGREIVPAFPAFRDVSWYAQRFALNRSYPAISDCNLNDDYGDGDSTSGSPTGFINRGIDWEVLADEPARYRIRFFCTLETTRFPVTFSVTPRRVQNFSLAQGVGIVVRNEDASGKVISESRIAADNTGRVTIPGFSVTSREGNILTLQNTSYDNHP
ncbi:hypothetical protein OpiT1DRAFT_04134 [Opitutaceae bacterium TAV1]|nr:hypothetical protein OpiT1DRAFT_04134 [Opitutaceae bacterium TAV1]